MILCEYEDEVSTVFLLLKRRRTALYRKRDIDFEHQMTHFSLEQLQRSFTQRLGYIRNRYVGVKVISNTEGVQRAARVQIDR